MLEHQKIWLAPGNSKRLQPLDQLLYKLAASTGRESADALGAVFNKVFNAGGLSWLLEQLRRLKINPTSIYVESSDVVRRYIEQGQTGQLLGLLESAEYCYDWVPERCIDILDLGSHQDIARFLGLNLVSGHYYIGAYYARAGNVGKMERYFALALDDDDSAQSDLIQMYRCYADWANGDYERVAEKLSEIDLQLQKARGPSLFKPTVLLAMIANDFGEKYKRVVDTLLSNADSAIKSAEARDFSVPQETVQILNFLAVKRPAILQKIFKRQAVLRAAVDSYLNFHQSINENILEAPFCQVMLLESEPPVVLDSLKKDDASYDYQLLQECLYHYKAYENRIDINIAILTSELSDGSVTQVETLKPVFDGQEYSKQLKIAGLYFEYAESSTEYKELAVNWLKQSLDSYRNFEKFDKYFLLGYIEHAACLSFITDQTLLYISNQVLEQNPDPELLPLCLRLNYFLEKTGNLSSDIKNFLQKCCSGVEDSLVEYRVIDLIHFLNCLQDFDASIKLASGLKNLKRRCEAVTDIVLSASVKQFALPDDGLKCVMEAL